MFYRHSLIIRGFKCGIPNMLGKIRLLDSVSSLCAWLVREKTFFHHLEKEKKRITTRSPKKIVKVSYIVKQNQFSLIFQSSSRAFNIVPNSILIKLINILWVGHNLINKAEFSFSKFCVWQMCLHGHICLLFVIYKHLPFSLDCKFF